MVFDMTTHGNIGLTGSETSACSGIALERQLHVRHLHDDAGVAGGRHADLRRADHPARRFDASTAPLASRRMPVTSQFSMMSTPSASAARA